MKDKTIAIILFSLVAIGGISACLMFIGIGIALIVFMPSILTWLAMIAITFFSVFAGFISICPLMGSLEKSNTEPTQFETIEESETEKIGFFAPFQLI